MGDENSCFIRRLSILLIRFAKVQELSKFGASVKIYATTCCKRLDNDWNKLRRTVT